MERGTLLRGLIAFAVILALMISLGLFMGWEKEASLHKPVPVDVE